MILYKNYTKTYYKSIFTNESSRFIKKGGGLKKEKYLKDERMKVDLIYDFIDKKGITKSNFCKLAKISLPVLNKILKQEINLNPMSIFKVCFLLDIEIHQFFEPTKIGKT